MIRKANRKILILSLLFLAGLVYFLREGTPKNIFNKAEQSQIGNFDMLKFIQRQSAFNSNRSTWQAGTFCDKFVEHTYSEHYQVCMNDTSSRIDCFGTEYCGGISTCVLRNIGFLPASSYHLDEFADGGMWLNPENTTANLRSPQCKTTVEFGELLQHVDHGDYMEKIVEGVALAQPKGPCEVYIKGKVYIHIGHAAHIYFKILDWYNLFVAHEKFGGDNAYIIRLNKGETPFMFPEMEVKLFGNTRAVEDIPNGNKVHCADEIVIVPWSFTSVPFRCKNELSLVDQCFECKGAGLTDTYLSKFRAKVLNACGLVDNQRSVPTDGKVNLLVILRKPYIRSVNDKLSSFLRILTNQNELIDALKKSFPRATVNSIFMEDHSICEQISMVHEADIFMGGFYKSCMRLVVAFKLMMYIYCMSSYLAMYMFMHACSLVCGGWLV